MVNALSGKDWIPKWFFVQITITRAISTHAVDVIRWCSESRQLMHLYYAGDSHQFLVGVAHGLTLLASSLERSRVVGGVASHGAAPSVSCSMRPYCASLNSTCLHQRLGCVL